VKPVSITVPKLTESQRRKSIAHTSKLIEEKMATELSTPPPKLRTLRTPISAPASIAKQSPKISYLTETKSTRSATAVSKAATPTTPTETKSTRSATAASIAATVATPTAAATPTSSSTPLTPLNSLRKRKVRDNEGTSGSDYKSNTYSTPIKRSKGNSIDHSDTKIPSTKKNG